MYFQVCHHYCSVKHVSVWGKSLAVRDERKCTQAKTVKMVEVGFTMQASSHRTAGGQSSMVRWCESWRSGKGFWRGLDPNLGKGIDLTRSSPGPRTGCIYIEFTSISKQGAAPAVLARHETRFHVTLHQAPSPLHCYTSGTPRPRTVTLLVHLVHALVHLVLALAHLANFPFNRLSFPSQE